MQDNELYQKILGLQSPWQVKSLELDPMGGVIKVLVEHPEGNKFPCPKCGEELGSIDHSPQRSWLHLDTCQFQTQLIGKCMIEFPRRREIALGTVRHFCMADTVFRLNPDCKTATLRALMTIRGGEILNPGQSRFLERLEDGRLRLISKHP